MTGCKVVPRKTPKPVSINPIEYAVRVITTDGESRLVRLPIG